MAPTHRNEEIEGRSYKDYVYSPVPVSSSSAVSHSTTLSEKPPAESVPGDKQAFPELFGFCEKCGANKMTEKGSTLLQYIAAAAANLSTMTAGVMLGWTSPILSRLQRTPVEPDNPLGVPITKMESAWIGSLVAIGATIGSFLAGYAAERWGRKRTLLFSAVLFLLGWVLVATTTVVAQLYAARIIFGIALAFPFTVVPMYCGEIAETSVRGALGSFLQLFITIGLLYAYAIGPYVSYVAFWIICACVPVAFFLCFMLMPESPYYLLKSGQREEAIAALAKLRSKSPASVQKEADEIQASVEEAFRNEAKFSDLFKVKANFKALIYTCLLASFQQLTGINVVLFYMEDIFNAAKTELSGSLATIIVGIVQMLASCVTPLVVDRLGRKMLLVFSGIGGIVTLAALGLYFYLMQAVQADVSSLFWLPVVSLVVFISTYSVGWGPLPWAVMGEMFEANVKSKASGITVCICWLLAFFITRFSDDLSAMAGNYTLFWVFAVCCVVAVLFTVLILPETKGKSLQEIQDELNGVKRPMREGMGIETIMKT